MDNPSYNNLYKTIKTVATDLDISVVSIESGFGPKELPDWGGRHFRLLKKPQIAILSHEGFNSYDVGVSWWSIDHHLGIRHSQIYTSIINYADLVTEMKLIKHPFKEQGIKAQKCVEF